MAEVRVEGGKGHQRRGWVLESLVRHLGRLKGTSTGVGDPPCDGNALFEREPLWSKIGVTTKSRGNKSWEQGLFAVAETR